VKGAVRIRTVHFGLRLFTAWRWLYGIWNAWWDI